MYNGGFGAASPPLTANNPFINDPTHPSTRFPDISGSLPSNRDQHSSWSSNGANMTPGAYNMQQPTYQQYPQQQQPMSPMNGYAQQQTGYIAPSQGAMPFQPTSSFGQQMAAHMTGSSYDYSQGLGQQQQTAYNPVQQQLQSPGYMSQLDPYGSIAQGWGGGGSQAPQQAQTQVGSHIQTPGPGSGSGLSASGDPHPRHYIRTHKAEIESWDSYAWKQLLNSFGALKSAWESRKKELGDKVGQLQMQMQYGGYYQGQVQQEGARLQGLQKEADLNFDSVAASAFQMQEVFQGYRQSGDQASKRRVREATNAALQSLPDWPPQTY